MIDPKTPAQNTLLIYMIFVLILLFMKPKFLFTASGKLKSFGCGHDKTPINFPIVVIGSGILFYLIFATWSVIYK